MNKSWKVSIVLATATALFLIWLSTYPNGKGGERLGHDEDDKWQQIKKQPRPKRVRQDFLIEPPLTEIKIVPIPDSESKTPLQRLWGWIDKNFNR